MLRSMFRRRFPRPKLLGTLLATFGITVTTWATTVAPAQAASHRTVTVQPGTGTISAAVAAAHPGDTLTLLPGTFYDSVFIPISLHITGAGSARTVTIPASALKSATRKAASSE